MADKIYCGSGKERKFADGSLIGCTLDLQTLYDAFKDYGFTTEQGKKKIRVNVSARREIDQYGNSHSISIDTWKPEKQYGNNQSSFDNEISF